MSESTAASPRTDLRSGIKRELNRASAENGSDTPDHILADYLLACLDAFDAATHARRGWYGAIADDEFWERPANEGVTP